MLLEEVKSVTLYCDQSIRVNNFLDRFKKINDNNLVKNLPEITIEVIPELNENLGNDMVSLIQSMKDNTSLKELEILPDSVLFFSGTPVHILAFIQWLGFKRVMTYERGRFLISSVTNQEIIEKYNHFSIDEILELHGLNQSKILHKSNWEPQGSDPIQLISKIQLDSPNVLGFYWEQQDNRIDYSKGGLRRRFALTVRFIQQGLGRYGWNHYISNQELSNWCRNTQNIPPGFDEEEEE